MKCGLNMSFANRQVILHRIRKVFSSVFGRSAEDLGMHMVYDVAHNTAKLEAHTVDGEERLSWCIVRARHGPLVLIWKGSPGAIRKSDNQSLLAAVWKRARTCSLASATALRPSLVRRTAVGTP